MKTLVDQPVHDHEKHARIEGLTDPRKYHDPVDVIGCDSTELTEKLRSMLIIRKAEEKIGEMVAAGVVKCPCHLGIGQEAIAVGLATHLRSTDRVFGAHRSHTHFLAMNRDVYALFAEVLGRVDGCSGGMGGSMHLYDGSSGFLGSVPIVAATVPIACGAALAAKMDGNEDVAVSYFGDGATEEGATQESFNLAKVMKLPIVFVCENNLFASHMDINLRQPYCSTARFAQANCMPSALLDGNDVVSVSRAAAIAVEHARNGDGPFFLEAFTYRWRGHVGPWEDLDVGVKRGDDLALWKKRDPVRRLFEAMEKEDWLSAEGYIALQDEVEQLIQREWAKAEQADFPQESILLDLVYSMGKVPG